jgi:hypothetical protein
MTIEPTQNLMLAIFLNQGHHTFFNLQLLQQFWRHLALDVHQGIAEAIYVISGHNSSLLMITDLDHEQFSAIAQAKMS